VCAALTYDFEPKTIGVHQTFSDTSFGCIRQQGFLKVCSQRKPFYILSRTIL